MRWLFLFTLIFSNLTHLSAKGTMDTCLPSPSSSIKQRIDKIINAPGCKSWSWGIQITCLDTGKTIYSNNAEKLMVPASCMKLFTAATLLKYLPSDYQIDTTLYTSAPQLSGETLRGDLVLYGKGDPSLQVYIDKKHPKIPSLEALVKQIADLGIISIAGNVIADASFFQCPKHPKGWEKEDTLYYYAPEVSALSINENRFEVIITPGVQEGQPATLRSDLNIPNYSVQSKITTSSANSNPWIQVEQNQAKHTVVFSGNIPLNHKPIKQGTALINPAKASLFAFESLLKDYGIRLEGDLILKETPSSLTSLTAIGQVQSISLKEMLEKVLVNSNNLYSEQLSRHLGSLKGAGRSDKAAKDLLKKYLKHLYGKEKEISIADSSGLSRHNLVSAKTLTELLSKIQKESYFYDFYSQIPISGKEGTVRNRIYDISLHLKTGFMGQHSASTGYCATSDGTPIAFSIIANNTIRKSGKKKPEKYMDEIIKEILLFKSSTSP